MIVSVMLMVSLFMIRLMVMLEMSSGSFWCALVGCCAFWCVFASDDASSVVLGGRTTVGR